MRRIAYVLLACLTLLGGIELALRHHLFNHTSYSNSESIDRQLRERNVSDRWRVLFVGDSEVRWGIHPGQIDEAFRQAGMPTLSFNHAMDGFGASWWMTLLPPLLSDRRLRNVEFVVVGVQLIDAHNIVGTGEPACGALQKPVLTSSFGIDMGLQSLCAQETWDTALGRKLFSCFWTVRYASAVRSLILPSAILSQQALKFNSRKSGEPFRGFEPHLSLAEEGATYEEEFRRWKAQFDAESDLKPLPPSIWVTLTADEGFFDKLNHVIASTGRKLALFALPTNPVVIDTFHRREDYARSSQLLAKWAGDRNVPFVDLGIQDVPHPSYFFSDMRHLSEEGARQYSATLGQALATAIFRLYEQRPLK